MLRSKTTDDLQGYLAGDARVETGWLSTEQQHEEAWFLGLRLNGGVKPAELKREFGAEAVARVMPVVKRLAGEGLLDAKGRTVRLTDRGRLLSNEVFQEFLMGVADAGHPHQQMAS